MSTDQHSPAWIEPAAADAPKRRMLVQVRTEAGRRFEWHGQYASTFAAYDDALAKHPHAARIEVRPDAQVIPLPTSQSEARRA